MDKYINAEELKKHFPKDEDWDCPVNTNSLVCELIDAQPTADVAPVKHGHWIPLNVTERPFRGFYMCSECNEVTIKAYPYCHCGADMREVEK